MTTFDPADHIPEPVHTMDGYDETYCSCGWASDDPKAGGWLDHLPDSLDAAWAAAEAAAEAKGWRVESVHRATYQPQFAGGQNAPMTFWEAEARGPWEGEARGSGPSPAAALRALAERLRSLPVMDSREAGR